MQKPSNTEEEHSISEKISIAVPESFLQYDLQNFFTSLKEEGLEIQAIPYTDFDEIKSEVQNGYIEIALLPYDQVRNEDFLSFTFQEKLAPFFKDEVAPLVNEKTMQFLPFAIDPLGFFTFSGPFTDKNLLKNKILSSEAMDQFLFSWKSKKTLAFPLRYGIRTQSFKNPDGIDEALEIFRNELLEISDKAKTDLYLSGWMNAIFMTNVKGNIQDFEKNMFEIREKVNPQIKNCQEYQKECLFLYRFIDLIPEFYSRRNLFLDKFPQKKSSFNDIQFFLPSYAQITEPIRVWWWVASDRIEETSLIYRFLENYMGLAVSTGENQKLRPSMIPAFSGAQFEKKIYAPTQKTKIITENQFLTKHKKDVPLQQLLDFSVEAKDYLNL